MGLDYLDLYLNHWPGKDKYQELWKALESLNKEGLIKAIGVSKFEVSHLENLLQVAKVIPVINQIEFYPMLIQSEVREYCSKHDIQIEAWSPLMNGELLKNEVIIEK